MIAPTKRLVLCSVLLSATLAGCATETPETAVALNCEPGTVPGWYDENGLPTSCVTDTAMPVEDVHFAAAGDSITAWIDRSGGDVSAGSWTTYTAEDGLTFVFDGWAKGGAKLTEIAANTTPVNTAEVLVIMAGTNDLGDRWGTPVDQMRASIVEIATKSQAPIVVLSAVAPYSGHGVWSTLWNAELAQLAGANGWVYVDPWPGVRAADGGWAPGASVDGIHPTPATAEYIAPRMRELLLAAVS